MGSSKNRFVFSRVGGAKLSAIASLFLLSTHLAATDVGEFKEFKFGYNNPNLNYITGYRIADQTNDTKTIQNHSGYADIYLFGNVKHVDINGDTKLNDKLSDQTTTLDGVNSKAFINSALIKDKYTETDKVENIENTTLVIKNSSISTPILNGFDFNAGAYARNSNANLYNNKVEILDHSNMTGNAIIGAYLHGGKGEVGAEGKGNLVTISNVSLGNHLSIVGGKNESGGNSKYNNVTIKDLIDSDGKNVKLYGGVVGPKGIASHNTVDVDNVAFGDGAVLLGGKAYDGKALYNVANVKNSYVYDINGGDGKMANYNTVSLTNSAASFVLGGSALNASEATREASYNTVTIKGTHTKTGSGVGRVYGGFSSGTASSNRVVISDIKTTKEAFTNVTGGESSTQSNYNTVEINNLSQLQDQVAYFIIGGTSGEALGNKVKINNASYNSGNYAVNIIADQALAGGAKENNINISNLELYNNKTNEFIGGSTFMNNATDNTIEIKNLPKLNNTFIVGGESKSYEINSEASNNKVSFINSTTLSDIYGGKANLGRAINNTVTLGGDSVGAGNIYGGFTKTETQTNDLYDRFLGGNTLKVDAKKARAKNLFNFENMTFKIWSDYKNDDTILTLDGGEATDLQN